MIYTSLKDGQVIHKIQTPQRIKSVIISPDGEYLIAGLSNGQLVLIDEKTGRPKQEIIGAAGEINSLSFSPDKKVLTAVDDNKQITHFDFDKKQFLAKSREHGGQVKTISYSPDGQRFITADINGEACLWSYPDFNLVNKERLTDRWLMASAFSTKGEYFFLGGDDTHIHVWGNQMERKYGTRSQHRSRIVSMKVSPNGNVLAASSRDKTISLWKIKDQSL